MLNIGWIPETFEEKQEAIRQEMANYTDVNSDFCEKIRGLSWPKIYQIYLEFTKE